MRKHYTPSIITTTVIFIILYITTEVLNYISNQGIYFILYTSGIWVLTYVSTIMYSKIIELLSLFFFKVKEFSYLIIIFPLAPTFYICAEIISNSAPDWLPISHPILKTLFTIDILIILTTIGVLCIILCSKQYLETLNHVTKNITETSPFSSNGILSEPEHLLGQGNTKFDRVIRALFYRVNRSEKTAKLSLAIIVLLVFIGGSISIGTIALDQFSKLRQLEKVRQNMLFAIDQIDRRNFHFDLQDSKDSTVSIERQLDNVIANSIKTAVEATFGDLEDTKNYKQLLENIQKKESYNINEIIMRVAIAALTFFLVQVFLRIYKYNQQQSTSLLTKAEVLELFNEEGADKEKLRELLASKIEGNPKFGNTPTTPIEQIINIADKAKSNGTPS
jgi:hypothetical protein